jgi:hypothetical protein
MATIREIQRHIRVAQTPTAIVFADSPYTVVPRDFALLCDCTGGAITVNLPAVVVSNGREITVKKIDSTGNAVTVTAV